MISVACPVSKMENGTFFFTRLLDSLWCQSYQDFEIVVTDNSDDDELMNICIAYDGWIEYYRNPIKGMAQNTNEAIRKSKGELIKIMYQDDYLSHKHSLLKTLTHFERGWLVSGCLHDDGLEVFKPHTPRWDIEEVKAGRNIIGSPSLLTMENDNPLLFDENLTWLLDLEYYGRLYKRYGEPTILKDKSVTIGLHPGQMTHLISMDRKKWEHEYLNEKNKTP